MLFKCYKLYKKISKDCIMEKNIRKNNKAKPAHNKRLALRQPKGCLRVRKNTSRAVRPLWCFLLTTFGAGDIATQVLLPAPNVANLER